MGRRTESGGAAPRSALEPTRKRAIQRAVLAFFRDHQRALPWRETRDPYAIWISEVMLQQTRVATVIPYYERWLARFPTPKSLADAELDDVLAVWSGLGYYSRARNLHRGAREIVDRYGGTLPRTADALRELPGIGRYTAGAIASQAFGEAAAIVDGNVARLFARVFAIEDDIKGPAGLRELWSWAEALVPSRHAGAYNQGLMELGATVCTPRSPICERCPLADHCQARRDGRQHQLPVVRRRPRAQDKPRLDMQALYCRRGERTLFARRRAEGLYGGLWELPQGEDIAAAAAAIGSDLHVEADQPVFVHEQELSHRRLRIAVWPGRATGRRRRLAEESPYDRVSWLEVGEAEQGGLSSATRNILAALARAPGRKRRTAS